MSSNIVSITIIYDNTAWDKQLIADWGFACLVRAFGKTILFDTGANPDILFENMNGLGIDPLSVDEVFISHHHWDHNGGLAAFLEKNNVPVYSPVDFKLPEQTVRVTVCEKLQKIHDNIWSTGILDSIEHSLLIKRGEQVIVIAGCSHPGVYAIFNAAEQLGKVTALIGGLHGFDQFDLINNIDRICPTHCTQYIEKIKRLYPEKWIEGGAGRIISL